MYDYNREDGTQGADDFTQLLWKGTKKFGIGLASTKKGNSTCTYVVARYRPTGNVAGAFRDNVALALDRRTCTNPATVGGFIAQNDKPNNMGKVGDVRPLGKFHVILE